MNHVMRKRAAPCREKNKEKGDERGGRQNPSVTVMEKVVWKL